MNTIVPIDDVIRLTRFRMYEAVAVYGMDRVDAGYIAGIIGHDVTAGFVTLAFRQLVELNEIELLPMTKPMARLLPAGARQVESDLRKPDSRISKYQLQGLDAFEDTLVENNVPAADRTVSRNDNQSAHDQAVAEIAALKEALRTSNEAGEAFGEEKDIALREVTALAELIASSKTRVLPVLAFAKRSLSWIIDKAGSASIAEIAKRALTHLIAWLTS